MRKAVIYIALVILVSCKKEINVNIAEKPAILVVNSELFNDSLIEVDLSLTQGIIDNSAAKKVNDAVIEVFSKDSLILDVLTFKGNGRYCSDVLKPKAGFEYLFRISQQNKVYWIDEQMPDSVKANVIDTSRGVFQGQANFFKVRLEIQNDLIKSNYYSFRIKRISKKIQGLDTILIEEWSDIQSGDFILTEDPESHFSKKHLLFTDTYFKGIQQEFKFGTSILDKTNQKTIKLLVYVTGYSFSAYKYYTSVNEHLFYQNDPFSQPTLIKGNVPNAYGAAVGQCNKIFEIQF